MNEEILIPNGDKIIFFNSIVQHHSAYGIINEIEISKVIHIDYSSESRAVGLSVLGSLGKTFYRVVIVDDANKFITLQFEESTHELRMKGAAHKSYSEIVSYLERVVRPAITKQKIEAITQGEEIVIDKIVLTKSGLSYSNLLGEKFLEWSDFLGVNEKWDSAGTLQMKNLYFYARWKSSFSTYTTKIANKDFYFCIPSTSNKQFIFDIISYCMLTYSNTNHYWILNTHFIIESSGNLNVTTNHLLKSNGANLTKEILGVSVLTDEQLIDYSSDVAKGKHVFTASSGALILTNKRLIFKEFYKKEVPIVISLMDLQRALIQIKIGKLFSNLHIRTKSNALYFNGTHDLIEFKQSIDKAINSSSL